jgi:hypothetical protein
LLGFVEATNPSDAWQIARATGLHDGTSPLVLVRPAWVGATNYFEEFPGITP